MESFYIPMDDLNNEERAREWINFLHHEFDEYGVSWDDFTKALELLRQVCVTMSDRANKANLGVTVVGGTGGLVIGVVSTAGGIVAGAAVIVYAAGMYIQSAKWSGWQNSIAHFAYLIGKFRTNPGRGGGF
jgi:hypothetical protein